MNINDNYTDYYIHNRKLVMFTEHAIHDLAADNFHEDGLHSESAFDSIFDDFKFENGTPTIYLDDDWSFTGDTIRQMEIFCKAGFEDTVLEMRYDWSNQGSDPGEKIAVMRRIV